MIKMNNIMRNTEKIDINKIEVGMIIYDTFNGASWVVVRKETSKAGDPFIVSKRVNPPRIGSKHHDEARFCEMDFGPDCVGRNRYIVVFEKLKTHTDRPEDNMHIINEPCFDMLYYKVEGLYKITSSDDTFVSAVLTMASEHKLEFKNVLTGETIVFPVKDAMAGNYKIERYVSESECAASILLAKKIEREKIKSAQKVEVTDNRKIDLYREAASIIQKLPIEDYNKLWSTLAGLNLLDEEDCPKKDDTDAKAESIARRLSDHC